MAGLQYIDNLSLKDIKIIDFDVNNFKNSLEIGWRLARKHLGLGLITEASNSWIKYGFEIIKIENIYAFLVYENIKSISVMKKLGMKHLPNISFYDPYFTDITSKPLVTYSYQKSDYKSQNV